MNIPARVAVCLLCAHVCMCAIREKVKGGGESPSKFNNFSSLTFKFTNLNVEKIIADFYDTTIDTLTKILVSIKIRILSVYPFRVFSRTFDGMISG